MSARDTITSTIGRRPPRRLAVAGSSRRPATGWMVRIILAGDATFDRRMGVALTASLADVAGSVHGRGHDPFTGLTRIEAMLVLDDDTERHALDAACAGLGRFRRAAGQVGLPDWPIVDIRVTDPAAEVW